VKECGASPQCLQRVNGLAPENVICPLHFWGFRHGIEIPPLQVPETSKMPNQTQGLRTDIPVKGKFRLVAGLNAEFDTQRGHMQGIEDLKRKIACTPIPEFHTDLLLKELAISPIHIAYFFCHATGGKGSSDSALILQAPGSNEKPEWLPWNDIAQTLVGKLSEPPALVFLNGCRTAAYRPDALSPFIRVFVDQAGASGLIGTEISVWDVFAAEIAEKFLREFLDCKPAGPALLKARRAMLAKKNPLGLVYTLFAWNDLKLVADA
jgi:CHAT domain